MIHVRFSRVEPENVDRLKAWFAEAEARADEVRETFVQEGVRHEQGFLLDTQDGPVLMYVIECDDLDAALEVFRASEIPIDVQHRELMPQLTSGTLNLSPILNIRL